MDEHGHQTQFVNWFRATYPHKIFAIPNGGKRPIRTATKLKREGVLKGVPDLQVPALDLWIEMKTPEGRLRSDQKEMIAYLTSDEVGDTVIVGKGDEDARAQVIEFMEARNGI